MNLYETLISKIHGLHYHKYAEETQSPHFNPTLCANHLYLTVDTVFFCFVVVLFLLVFFVCFVFCIDHNYTATPQHNKTKSDGIFK